MCYWSNIIDTTKLTPAHILVIFLTSGVVLGAVGSYKPLIEFAEAEQLFLYRVLDMLLVKGAIDGVKAKGIIGAFVGGLEATAGGEIAAAILFGYIAAIVFDPTNKS